MDTPLRASAAAVVPPLGSVGSASAGVHPRRQVGWGERSRTRRRTERCTRCISSRRSSLEGGERLSPSGGDAVGSCRAAAARPLPPPMVPVGAGAAAARRSGRRGGGRAPGMSVSARVQKCPATSAVRGTVRDGGRRRGGGGAAAAAVDGGGGGGTTRLCHTEGTPPAASPPPATSPPPAPSATARRGRGVAAARPRLGRARPPRTPSTPAPSPPPSCPTPVPIPRRCRRHRGGGCIPPLAAGPPATAAATPNSGGRGGLEPTTRQGQP